MKRGTPDHWKMKELAKRAKVPALYALPWANGTMERFWHYVAQYHPSGDISNVPDWAIAEACAFPILKREGRPGIDHTKAACFMRILIDSGWVDEWHTTGIAAAGERQASGIGPAGERHRTVHDWADHCQDSTKKLLKIKELQGENPASRARAALAMPKPKPEPEPSGTGVPDLTCEELEAAWDRHRNYRGNEPQDLAFRRIHGMNGKFKVERFRERHRVWCEYWTQAGWNSYGSLTFLGWIEAGMPNPPQAVEKFPAEGATARSIRVAKERILKTGRL